MRRSARLSTVGLVLSLVGLLCVPAQAARPGLLRGLVCDQYGAPLPGATIAIFDATTTDDKPVRNTVTDAEGRFKASVAPGRYVLRALASGFTVGEARALVNANKETIINSLELRRDNTLVQRRHPIRDMRRESIRASRSKIFFDKETAEEEREREMAEAMALTESASSTHGVVQAVASTGRTGAEGSVAMNFAMSHRVGSSDLTAVGQTGVGDTAPQRVEALTTTDIGDNHRLTVAFGYGRILADGPDGTPTRSDRLGQYSVQATDHWQAAGPVVLIYGVNYTRFSGASHDDALLPRLGVEFAATSRTQVSANLTPGASLKEIATFASESGEIDFTEAPHLNVPVEDFGKATIDRSQRLDFGVGHLIDERSNVEFVAFFDTAVGHGIGLLAVPSPGSDPRFVTRAFEGRTSGVRVFYTRRLNDILSASAGYAVGRGQKLGEGGLADPVHLFEQATFQVLTARLDADFDSGTRISTVYRLSPNAVVFAIDPFAGRLSTIDPSLNLYIAQELPSLGFLPAQMEATLDVRNLFNARPSMDDGELTINEFDRLVRAGLSFRF